jgi:hypothetical protein
VVALADVALLAAKRAGRNRVVIAGQEDAVDAALAITGPARGPADQTRPSPETST